jgi:1-acyl-sn-glycerol-3-phosphate acyltransferase
MAPQGVPGPSSDEPLPLGYALVRRLVRFLLALFYRRIEVVGLEHVPRSGPLIVAANHHNSVVDAMLLIAVLPRRLRTLANAPLFKHPFMGPFLRLVGALPVHRRKEAGNDPARNAALFAATTETLQAGGAILIFPEGRTQPEPVLMELRTGAARMLLAAEALAETPRVQLLPVGLVFHEPGTFRAGRALVVVGEPVVTADCVTAARTSPEQAARTMTDRLAEALRAQIVEADDRATLRLLTLLEELWRVETGGASRDEAARAEWLRQAMHAYRILREREPARVAKFRGRLEGFDQELKEAGLTTAQSGRAYTWGGAARFALREGLTLLVSAPFALAGIVLHAVPYLATDAVVRRMQHTAEEEATDKIAAGIVLYPVAWVFEALVVGLAGGSWALAVFLACLLPTGFFALAWRERLAAVRLEARAFWRSLRRRDAAAELLARRNALAADLAALARMGAPSD